jgi:glutamate decarboxylase
VVVKDGFSHDMADLLLADMRRHLAYFASQPDHEPKQNGGQFRH